MNAENKRKSLQVAIDLFEKAFGHKPKSIGSYVMDSYMMEVIKELSPETTTVIASCFEEGVKVYHGCNNSWYLFSEGGSFMPWFPSKKHSLAPAANKEDWNGMVAIPHLSRDLSLAFEGRNDYFASHPANVQRGLANDGEIHPYDYNLVDQYRMQEDFNDGYSFYNVHVGPTWLGYAPNIHDEPEVSQKLYLDTLAYLAKLRDDGEVRDMIMSEFGEWFKENMPIEKPVIGLGKEMLYGSGKHYIWHVDGNYRILINTNLGGSIGDFRPYIANYSANCGVDEPKREILSFPYLIQSVYRTGTTNHFADGSRTTLFVTHDGETLDLCKCRCKLQKTERTNDGTVIQITPASLTFSDGFNVKIETTYKITPGGDIFITRKILEKSMEGADLHIEEYFKGCYGFTEYPEDMKGIKIKIDEKEEPFVYSSKKINKAEPKCAGAEIPQIGAMVSISTVDTKAKEGYVKQGHLFDPYYTLSLTFDMSEKKTNY